MPQCDISCVISPEHFREFAVPALRCEMALLDAVVYHLDGPGALIHLPAILELAEIDAVQWVAGAGEPGERDWTDLYREIAATGKGLTVNAINGGGAKVRALSRALGTSRIFFRTAVASRAEGEALLADLEAGERMKAEG